MATPPSPEDGLPSSIGGQVLEVGARLECGPSERLIQTAFQSELDHQAELFAAMSLVDLAHTLVMMEAGVIPAESGRDLLAALLRLQESPATFRPHPVCGDLYTNREAWLLTQTDAAAWLGAGRARREATTTAFLITVRTKLLELADALTTAGRVWVTRAREFGAALMPDYTYLQAAQPTTFGHYLLAFVDPLLRDLDRIRALFERVNRSPAGCGSTNGSRLPQPRARLGALLGFDGLVTHARDAMWQADLHIEVAATLTAILVNLSRLAEDLQIYATEEFGLVELDDRHARASKIMPQKKNPFALTHVRGMAHSMIGTLAATAATACTPSGQPDNRLTLYGIIPQAIEATRDNVALMEEVVGWLRFDSQRGRARLENGFALATDLAEVLVLECGLDFRQAHRLVGFLVRRHLENGDLSRLTAAELTAAAEQNLGQRVELSQSVLQRVFDPEGAILARTGPGGAAPDSVDRMIASCMAALEEAEVWTSRCRRRIRAAEASLRDGCEPR